MKQAAGTMTFMPHQVTVRRVLLAFCGVLVALCLAHLAKFLPHTWKTYTAPDGSFSIDLPGEATVETAQAAVHDGLAKSVTLVSVKPTDTTAYTCTYVEDD